MTTEKSIHDLTGTVSLVVGGGSGMGREAAVAFARAGSAVVVGDLNLDGAHETLSLVEAEGGQGIALEADACKAADHAALVASAVREFGRLDAAVNAVGMTGPAGTVTEYDDEEWDRVFDVNLRATYLALKHQVAQMLSQPEGGAIVNISSALGLIAAGDYPAYVASKHGVIGLTRSAAIAYAPKKVRINAICPGSVRTPMWERAAVANPDQIEEWAAAHPIGRIAEAREVGEVLVWLCSPGASFIVGAALPVDGGMTTW